MKETTVIATGTPNRRREKKTLFEIVCFCDTTVAAAYRCGFRLDLEWIFLFLSKCLNRFTNYNTGPFFFF